MGKCNTVHPGKRNLKHRHPKGGRILESSKAGGDLRVKWDMNLQYDLTAWAASAVVLYREGRIWEHGGRSPSCHSSDHTRSWVPGHWEGIENMGELRKKEKVDWQGVSMRRNAIKTPTPHFLKASGTFAFYLNHLGVAAVCLLPVLRAVLMSTRCPAARDTQSQEVWASLPPALAACRSLSLGGLGWGVQEPGPQPNSAMAAPAAARESWASCLTGAKAEAMGTPYTAWGPALPQEDMGQSERNSGSREPKAGPGHQGGTPRPAPTLCLTRISLTSWLHIMIVGSRNQNPRLLPSTLPQ